MSLCSSRGGVFTGVAARGGERRATPRARSSVDWAGSGEITAAQSCNAEAAARALARGTGDGEIGLQNTEIEEPAGDCKWLQYTAALAVCTTAGPVIYWPCAYLAYCSFCTGNAGICI